MHRLKHFMMVALLGLTVLRSANAEPLSLDKLIMLARANDHRVKSAEAQLRVYRAMYDQARYAWIPKIESTFTLAGPMPEAKNDGLGGPPTSKATYLYDVNLGVPGVMLRVEANAVMPVFTFGKLSALTRAASYGVEAGQALTASAADEAEFQVAQAYYGYCLAQLGLKVLAETKERIEEAKTMIARLLEQKSAQVTRRDLFKAEYFIAMVESQRVAAESGAAIALAAIRLLIDRGPQEPLEIAVSDMVLPEDKVPPLETYLEKAGGRRPELIAMSAGVRAQEQLTLLRQRMYYPDFALAGFFRWVWTTSSTRQRSPFAYDPYNDLSTGIGLVMRYSWDFPTKRSELEIARANLSKIRSEQKLLNAGVRLQIEKAWSETQSAYARAESLTAAQKSSQKWLTSAFSAFDIGVTDTRELVDALTAHAAVSAQRGQALFDVQVGLRSIARATGLRAAPAVNTSSGETLRNP